MSGRGCAGALDQTASPEAITPGRFARSPPMERHAPLDTSRQPDPAEPAPFPEYGAATDARGPAAPVLDTGVEHGARRAVVCTVVSLVARRAWIGRPEARSLPAGRL